MGKVKITKIHKEDAFFGSSRTLVGVVGTAKLHTSGLAGYKAGTFVPDSPLKLGRRHYPVERIYFAAVQVEPVEE